MGKWVVNRIGKEQTWYSADEIDKIKEDFENLKKLVKNTFEELKKLNTENAETVNRNFKMMKTEIKNLKKIGKF